MEPIAELRGVICGAMLTGETRHVLIELDVGTIERVADLCKRLHLTRKELTEALMRVFFARERLFIDAWRAGHGAEAGETKPVLLTIRAAAHDEFVEACAAYGMDKHEAYQMLFSIALEALSHD